jgi:hypothetical protein
MSERIARTIDSATTSTLQHHNSRCIKTASRINTSIGAHLQDLKLKPNAIPQQDDSQKDEYADQTSAPTAEAKIDKLTLRLGESSSEHQFSSYI